MNVKQTTYVTLMLFAPTLWLVTGVSVEKGLLEMAEDALVCVRFTLKVKL